MRNILDFVVWLVKRHVVETVLILNLLALIVTYLTCDIETFKLTFLFSIGMFFGWCGVKIIEYTVIYPLIWAYGDYMKEKNNKEKNKCK